MANGLFFRFFAQRVNKQTAIVGLAGLGVIGQGLYALSESSVTMLCVVAGLDALSVSLLIGIIGGVLAQIIKAGSGQGELFGSVQALGGLASFVTALVNSLLAGVSLKAPFIFCALSMIAVLVWALRLPDEARAYTDQQTTDGP